MYAIIRTGGKQYKVKKDDIVVVEKLDGEPGAEILLDHVLMVGEGSRQLKIGTPFIKGASVLGEIVSQGKSAKVLIFKRKRRQNYHRFKGHRQQATHVKIKDIKIA